jgi:hypothetical protein
MPRKLSLSLAMLALGVGLLVASGVARPSVSTSTAGQAREGGTLRLSRFSDVDFVDSALAYTPWSWAMEYATCAKGRRFESVRGLRRGPRQQTPREGEAHGLASIEGGRHPGSGKTDRIVAARRRLRR